MNGLKQKTARIVPKWSLSYYLTNANSWQIIYIPSSGMVFAFSKYKKSSSCKNSCSPL